MRIAASSFLLLVVIMAAPSVLACDCAAPPGPKQSLGASTAVFSGKCIEARLDREKEIWYVTFEVDRVWKGDIGPKVTITTPIDSGACGYRFGTGKTRNMYFVYCYGKPDALKTDICTRTRELEIAGEDMKELGKGEPPKKEAD